jgi:hypothetical protein
VDLQLQRGLRLAGEVRDGRGDRVPRPRVRARVDGQWRGTVGDGGGAFEVVLPPGTAEVWLEADAPGFAAAGREVVLATEPRPVQLRLEAALAEVSGVVVQAGGVPVAGAEVRVRTLGSAQARTLRTRTDGRGSFQLTRLAAGPVQIDVSAGGLPGASRRAEAPARDLVLELASSVTLEGSARERRTGAPVDRFAVTLLRREGDASAVSASGRKGRFHLVIPAGPQRLRVRASGYAPADVSVDAPAGGAGAWLDVELSRAGHLEGQLWDSRGDAAAGARVRLLAASGDEVVAEERTSSEGRFRFADLAEGRYLVRAELSGEQAESAVEVVAGEDPVRLVLKLAGP